MKGCGEDFIRGRVMSVWFEQMREGACGSVRLRGCVVPS